MKTTTVNFVNRPNPDGTVLKLLSVPGCLIAQNGSPTGSRPEILVHLPKTFKGTVDGSWINYEDHSYHVIGTTIKAEEMAGNKPTPWDRYCIAERIV